MNRVNLIRVGVFICVLACAAVLISVIQNQLTARKAEQENQTKAEKARIAETQAEEKRKAQAVEDERARVARAAEAERQRYLGYMNTNITRDSGEQMIAVVCQSETREMNSAIGDALATHFRQDHIKFVTSFFRPAIIRDGLFVDLFDGSKQLEQKLELEKSLDGLLLARQEVEYSTNSDLNGLISAHMHLQVVTLAVARQIESQTWTLSANGAGFNNSDARMQAEERMVNQIVSNSTMTLKEFKSSN